MLSNLTPVRTIITVIQLNSVRLSNICWFIQYFKRELRQISQCVALASLTNCLEITPGAETAALVLALSHAIGDNPGVYVTYH